MSLTAGQKQYLLELLSHEYVLTAEQQPIVRQAICRYATTVYDQQELDFLVSLPQSLAICLYYQCGKQNFARQYGLWLNCLEHSIFQEMDGLEAVLLNPDPTGSEKLLALVRQDDQTLEAIPLPQFPFSNQPQAAGCSRWTLREARDSMSQFLQYAHSGANCQEEAEALSWCDLLQQARLFTMVKETYLFTAYNKGLPRPSGWQQMGQLPAVKKRPAPTPHSWMYQPPAHPFAPERKLMQQMKQSFSALQQRPFHLPEFPAPPRIKLGALPPFPFPSQRK